VATTQPSAARVLMSGADHTRLAQRARQQGLSGYLSKRMDAPAIVAALKHMLRGERFFADEDDGGGAAASIQLTARQTEVLQWVCEGRSSKEIARTLGVAERTVKDHLTLIYVRLGVRGRAEAVARAGALGLIRLEA
jgi:DNA-binding NarL/FixJ family response regulator